MPLAHESRFRVAPHSRVTESDDVVIGRPEASIFLSVSDDIVALLDWLGEGRSLAEAIELYEKRYGDAEGVPDTIETLAGRGFLEPADIPPGTQPEAEAGAPAAGQRLWLRLLDTAAVGYGPTGLALQALILAVAGVALWRDPGLVPGIRALFFERHVTLTSLAVMALSLGTLAFHEFAHMGATWRCGVRPRLGVSHRLWMLVAETDLSGLWSLPRRRRLLPILAGPLADAVFCGGVVLVLYAHRREWIGYGDLTASVLDAILLISVFRILWQCLLFVRTDFYYALAHLLRCRNLMADTEAYVASLARSVLPGAPAHGLARLPRHERQAVRAYAGLWLAGRLLALVFLVGVQIPLLFHFVALFVRTVWASGGSDLYRLADTLTMALFVLLTNGLGFSLWIRNSLRRRTPDGTLPADTTG